MSSLLRLSLLFCLFAVAVSLRSSSFGHGVQSVQVPVPKLYKRASGIVVLPAGGHELSHFGVLRSDHNASHAHRGLTAATPNRNANLLPSHLRYVLMSRLASQVGISPIDWLTQLVLQLLQSRQSLIPTDIHIGTSVTVLGLSITISRLTFTRPLIKTVSVTQVGFVSKGVLDGDVSVSASFPNAQLHAIVGEGSPEEAIDFGDLLLFINATDKGLTLPCSNPDSGKGLIGTVSLSGVHVTSTSADPMVTLISNVLNTNSQFINTLISGVVDGVIPSSFPIPSMLAPAISIVCIAPATSSFDARRLASGSGSRAGGIDPSHFLTSAVNALISSNPTLALSSSCTTRLDPLNLCDIASVTASWDGLNTACRDACQVPCQTEYGTCEVAWGLCQACHWLGCPCPDCDGARDQCQRACEGTCNYGVHADVAVQAVSGLSSVRIADLTLDPAKLTAAVTFTSNNINVQAHVDLTGIPTINPSVTINALAVQAVLGYSCPASANTSVVLELQFLTLSNLDLDSIFSSIEQAVGAVPFGIGDRIRSWIQQGQGALTGRTTPASLGHTPQHRGIGSSTYTTTCCGVTNFRCVLCACCSCVFSGAVSGAIKSALTDVLSQKVLQAGFDLCAFKQ